jgi:hypothetical protein
MENKKQVKIGVVLNIFILIAIVLMFFSFYYLYQKRVVEPSNKEVIINKFEMLLMFNKDNQINAHNIKPGWIDEREFTIENFSSDTIGKYNIIIEVITPLSNMMDDNFIYTLEGSSQSNDNSNKVINVGDTPIPVVTKDLGTVYITPKNVHNYKMVFKLNKGTKKYPSENLFSVRIKVVNAD